jgi:phosphoribosylpyrophosphate synthetase
MVVKAYSGKVVYILDDMTVTNETLRLAVQSLLKVGIHAHGVVWVSYS